MYTYRERRQSASLLPTNVHILIVSQRYILYMWVRQVESMVGGCAETVGVTEYLVDRTVSAVVFVKVLPLEELYRV